MPRMKIVFRNPEAVAKLWASQSQPRAEYSYSGCACGAGMRCGCYSNGKYMGTREKTTALYFEEERLFSYGRHYLMGTFLEWNGRKIAVLNRTKYSATTSSQFGVVSRAVEALGIPRAYIDGGDRKQKFNWSATETDIRAAVREEIAAERTRLKLQVERVENGCHHVFRVENTREEIQDFNFRMLLLGESASCIDVPEFVWQNGLENARRYEIARENHTARRQLELNFVTAKQLASMASRIVGTLELCREPDSWATRRRIQRRTS